MARSIIKNDRRCYVTGSTKNLDRHHCIYGSHRKQAEKYGLWVWLTHDVHMKLHNRQKPYEDLDLELKQTAERCFMEKYSVDEWMCTFGVNYLDKGLEELAEIYG